MGHVPDPVTLVQRIPIPDDCEEVEVKRRISVPGKPMVWVTAIEMRQVKRATPPKPVVSETPAPVKLKTGVVKPNPRPVKRPEPAKVSKPKRVFNRQPISRRPLSGCSFCGGGMGGEIGSIHARCQEAKDRIAGKK